MEALLSSDDSCDSEIKNMKNQLSGNVSIRSDCENLTVMIMSLATDIMRAYT